MAQPGSFSSKIKRYLRHNVVHSLHKPVRKKFKRRRIITKYSGQIIQMDLVDMQKFSGSNSNYNYILVVIDLFSKMIWLRPLKTKEGKETSEAIKSTFQAMIHPVQTVIFDEGKEFANKYVKILFDQYSIHSYNILTKTKAGAVERVNKTIKQKIWKYFTETGRKRWIDILDEIQNNYNNTYHNTIKMPPNKVTMENRQKVFKTMYPQINDRINCRMKIGDNVRIALNKETFEKAYTINWSTEIFKIIKVFQRGGVCWYRLRDSEGVIYPKGKYFYQLNKV